MAGLIAAALAAWVSLFQVHFASLNATTQLVSVDLAMDGSIDMEIQVNTGGQALTFADILFY